MGDKYGIQITAKAFVNDFAQKTDDLLIGTMTQFLMDKGYSTVYEINGANLICAIEKQIAKKPKWVVIRNVDYSMCPECERVLWGKEFYCATCGQKIDRGE